jgi:hypothetical protein
MISLRLYASKLRPLPESFVEGAYNPDMSRLRSELRCSVCGASPAYQDGRFVCHCPKFQWKPKKGYGGTAEDRTLLERHGWRQASDSGGFVYWIGPGRAGVINLYEDGTWSGGPAIFDKLEDYLDWYANGQLRPPSPGKK